MTEEIRLAIETLLEELERRGCTVIADDDPYTWLDSLDAAGFELKTEKS